MIYFLFSIVVYCFLFFKFDVNVIYRFSLSCLKVGIPLGNVSRQGCFSFLSTERRHLFPQCTGAWSILARVATYMFCMKTFGRARSLQQGGDWVSGRIIEGLLLKNVSSLRENSRQFCPREAERAADVGGDAGRSHGLGLLVWEVELLVTCRR